MAVACYFVIRALEDGRTKWLMWAGAAIGFVASSREPCHFSHQ
ncbi:glycosyltransferase family 39 protein [Streptomyces sp. NPDC001856]